MALIGALLFFISLIGFLLGMIKPSLVIWWGTNKTRLKVFLIFGLMFFISICLAVIGAPSNIEAGKSALAEKNYREAVTRLEAITSHETGYAEAQQLLPEAKKNLLILKLDEATTASLAGDHAKVIALLSDYPTSGAGSLDAAKMLADSKEELAEAERAKAENSAQEKLKEDTQDAARQAEKIASAAAREEKRALADFPECGTEEAQTEVARVLENAPLGRVFGLSLIKIKDSKQVSASAASRDCTGTALLNNAESYPMTYRFYRDDKDIMIEAQVLGLGE
jgi:hypothetical protein